MNRSIEQRVDELEVKLTFLDDAVHALATADADRSQRIAALERMLRELRGEISSMRSPHSSDARDEPPPPHY
jgi:SlyX protein